MPVTKPVVRSVLSRAVSSAIYTPGGVAVTRNLIKLNQSLRQYFTFASQESSGDFEIQVDFCVMATGSMYGIMREYTGGVMYEKAGGAYIYQNKVIVVKSHNSASLSVDVDIGIFNTLNLKKVGSTVTFTMNGIVEDSWQYQRHPAAPDGYIYNQLGNFANYRFEGYIKDFHLISGFPENKLFKLDEDLENSEAIIDSNGGSAGAMVNGGSAYSERFTLNTSVSPNVWVNDDASISLPIAGT